MSSPQKKNIPQKLIQMHATRFLGKIDLYRVQFCILSMQTWKPYVEEDILQKPLNH